MVYVRPSAIPKQFFFDSPAVLRATTKMERKNMAEFGSRVRRAAKQSIRKRKIGGVISKPGNPPFSKKGQLKKFIFFKYEPNRHNVVIGPELLPGSRNTLPTIPEVHEYSGKLRRKPKGKRPYTAKYPARSYMHPAFEQKKRELPQIWKDSLRK